MSALRKQLQERTSLSSEQSGESLFSRSHHSSSGDQHHEERFHHRPYPRDHDGDHDSDYDGDQNGDDNNDNPLHAQNNPHIPFTTPIISSSTSSSSADSPFPNTTTATPSPSVLSARVKELEQQVRSKEGKIASVESALERMRRDAENSTSELLDLKQQNNELEKQIARKDQVEKELYELKLKYNEMVEEYTSMREDVIDLRDERVRG